MAPLVLYYFSPSSHCRVALQVIRALGLEVDVRIVNLLKKEQLSEDFIKINPQHTIPTLVDDGFVLTESRAIILYLIEKYAPNSPLYSKDAQVRALIHQRLQFDVGTFYQRLRAICFPVIYQGETRIKDDLRQKLFEAIDWLNTFLEVHEYVAGTENPSVADISLFNSVANIVEIGTDLSKYPNVVGWLERCKAIPGSDECLEGAKIFAERIKSNLQDKL